MAFMTYFPLAATALSLAIAGSAGYIDLLLTDNSMGGHIRKVDDTLIDMSGDIENIEEGVENNEDSIQAIQQILIRRQGEIDLDVQALKNELENQDQKLDQALGILRSIQTQTR